MICIVFNGASGGQAAFEGSKGKYEFVQSQFRAAEDLVPGMRACCDDSRQQIGDIVDLANAHPAVLAVQDPFRSVGHQPCACMHALSRPQEDSAHVAALAAKLPARCSLVISTPADQQGDGIDCVARLTTVRQMSCPSHPSASMPQCAAPQ